MPEYLYLGGQYAEILDFLCSPVTSSANVKVLVSEPGLGKTLLLRSAIERIKPEARTAFVFWTLFKPEEFVAHLLFEMGSSEAPPEDLDAAQYQFENVLRHATAEGKRFVLAIDEAHNLCPAALKLLSALLDRDNSRPPQITVLLAGLPGLHDRLAHPEASGIRKRIAGVMTISPLDAEQMTEYTCARIAALGIGPLPPEQVANITASSGGVLRTADKLCHQLLLQNETWEGRKDDAIQERTAGNESPITTDAHVARVAAWATNRPGTWSGTVAELAAATCISVKEISDAVENRTQELRRAGISAAVQRSPGKPRMITLSPIEREQTPEPAQAAIAELREDQADPESKHEGREPVMAPELNQELAGNKVLHPTTGRASGWRLRAALVLVMLITALIGGLVYFKSGNAAQQRSFTSQPQLQSQRSPQVDQIANLGKREERGNTGSQTGLADQKHAGNGIPRDAVALYEQAATKGDPVAQHRLGLALSSGSDGVAADPVAAYAWLVMARNGGQANAQTTLDWLTHSLTGSEILDVRYKLGLMYEHGVGCTPDLVLADEWFLLGAAAGDDRSRTESAALERRMSPVQISQAHARSDEWLRRHSSKGETNTASR